MVTLTRLNDRQIVVNAEMIRTIESTPDTTLTMTSGDRMIVKETVDEVVSRVIEYGRHLRGVLPRS